MGKERGGGVASITIVKTLRFLRMRDIQLINQYLYGTRLNASE